VADGDERVQTSVSDDLDGDSDVEGWPLLSDLDLDVCVAEPEVFGDTEEDA
jgi:hypothetical protein